MSDFGFYDNNGGVILNEQIQITKDENTDFLVANSPKLKAQIYAPEINFYLENSSDNMLEKSKNTLLLYEARASAFDEAKDIDYEKKVGKNIVLISNDEREDLANLLRQNGFKVLHFTHFEIKFVYGAVGDLGVIVQNEGEDVEIDADFLLAQNARDYMLKQSGCFEIAGLSDDEVLKLLKQKSPNFAYKSFTFYDPSICQYHERRNEICAKCVEACCSVALLKDEANKHLVFSHIDCINCGECVAICPSGAIDSTLMPRQSFFQIAKFYKDKIALILTPSANLSDIQCTLTPNVLPFFVPSDKFLNETHLLTLLQESGSAAIFYAPFQAKTTMAAIELINQIYELKFKKTAIYVVKNKAELQDAMQKAKSIAGSQFSQSAYALPKREIFAKALKALVGGENLGEVYADGLIEYGTLSINEEKCTLCLSCVGACNVNALIADKRENAIKFNPSLCTACGYCELSCAEKDTLSLKRGKIELKPEFFAYKTLAKDELFKCVECGKEFATKKAVEKVATLMAGHFAGQDEKIKTLYCCADCKAKIMVKAQIDAMARGEYYE
ncbi:MAG: 4Fe-4S binding protein [Campylobacter sp.]|nr:4Fe-4S binding protein [Campylobacter sp.]